MANDRDSVIPLTDKQARALQILRDENITYASQFGRSFWGNDHPSWRKISKAGAYGSTRGGGMNLGSGGYLGKLQRKGLIYHGGQGRQYQLTDLGKRSLAAFEALQRAQAEQEGAE